MIYIRFMRRFLKNTLTWFSRERYKIEDAVLFYEQAHIMVRIWM